MDTPDLDAATKSYYHMHKDFEEYRDKYYRDECNPYMFPDWCKEDSGGKISVYMPKFILWGVVYGHVSAPGLCDEYADPTEDIYHEINMRARWMDVKSELSSMDEDGQDYNDIRAKSLYFHMKISDMERVYSYICDERNWYRCSPEKAIGIFLGKEEGYVKGCLYDDENSDAYSIKEQDSQRINEIKNYFDGYCVDMPAEKFPEWYHKPKIGEPRVTLPDFLLWCVKRKFIPRDNLALDWRRKGCQIPKEFDMRVDILILDRYKINLNKKGKINKVNKEIAKAEKKLANHLSENYVDYEQSVLAKQPVELVKRNPGRPPLKGKQERDEAFIKEARHIKNTTGLSNQKIAEKISEDETLNPGCKLKSTSIRDIISEHI